jgi:hypothetical protein
VNLKNIFRISAQLLVIASLSGEGLVYAAEPSLPPPPIVSGRVLDPQGQPASGATVHLIAHHRFGPGRAKTGKDGAFSFPVEVGGIYRLTAEKDGFGSARRAEPLRIRGSMPGIELRLNRPAGLSGRVVGLTAKELAGLSLTLEDQHEGASGTLKVEADGRYRVINLPPGDSRLQAQAGARSAQALVTVAEGDTKTVDVVFPRLTPVKGRVLRPDGTPAAEAPVICPGPGYDQGSTYSGKDGRFVSLAPEECKRVWARTDKDAPASAPVNVGAGPVDGITIHLQPGRTLTGRFLGLRDPDCKLSLLADGAGPFVMDGHVVAPGHYAIPGLGTGTWGVTATCGKYSAVGSVQIRSGETAPTLDLDFGPGHLVLSGRLLGEPGARYEVSLEQIFAPASPIGRAEVKSGGTFRFANLRPGNYVVYILEPDLPSDSIYRRPARLDGEEIFGTGDSYESIDQTKIDLQADREITLDVREGRQGGRLP